MSFAHLGFSLGPMSPEMDNWAYVECEVNKCALITACLPFS